MCDKKKYLFFLFIFFAFIYTPLSAQDNSINFFTDGMPDLSAQWGLSFPARRDLKNPSPSEDFIVAADYHELRIDSGIKYQHNQIDFTNRVIYMPTFFNCFQAGIGTTWHYYRYVREFSENDFIMSARFRWIKGPVFSFENAFGLLFKLSSIDAIEEYSSEIYNYSYQQELLCNWHLFNTADLWFAVNLQDYFDYPLAISPFIKFGFNYATKQNTVLGLDFTMKFVDMFFSAVYLNEAILRFSFKVVL